MLPLFQNLFLNVQSFTMNHNFPVTSGPKFGLNPTILLNTAPSQMIQIGYKSNRYPIITHNPKLFRDFLRFWSLSFRKGNPQTRWVPVGPRRFPLVASGESALAAFAADGVDLIDEDDGGSLTLLALKNWGDGGMGWSIDDYWWFIVLRKSY